MVPRRLLAIALLVLSAAVAAQPSDPPDANLTPGERERVVKGALAKLEAHYIFPESAKKAAASVRARMAKGEYAAIASAKELSRRLTSDLQAATGDKHLHMIYDPRGIPPDRHPDALPPPEEMERQRAWLEKVNFGFEKAERMRGNVGYVEIRGFVPPTLGAEAATAAMSFVARTDALIVDLRRNGGGEPAMIAYVTSYLFDEPTHLNDIYEREGEKTRQWWTLPHVPGRRYGVRKPVYVLVSKNTFSGGEEFAYNLKNLRRATIVGETTGGGAHPVRPFKIDERFAIGVPFARAINPITKKNWEGTGVAPDVSVPADRAFDAAYRMALEKMLETTTDPAIKDEIRKLLAEISEKKAS